MVNVLSILITILFLISTSVHAQPDRAIYYICLQLERKQPGDPFIIMEVGFLIIAVNVHKFRFLYLRSLFLVYSLFLYILC